VPALPMMNELRDDILGVALRAKILDCQCLGHNHRLEDKTPLYICLNMVNRYRTVKRGEWIMGDVPLSPCSADCPNPFTMFSRLSHNPFAMTNCPIIHSPCPTVMNHSRLSSRSCYYRNTVDLAGFAQVCAYGTAAVIEKVGSRWGRLSAACEAVTRRMRCGWL
jgi:hypothetical protein